jgi:hypothetical protein
VRAWWWVAVLCLGACGGAGLRPLTPAKTICPAGATSSGALDSAIVVIAHEQRTKGPRIVQLVYALDGTLMFTKSDTRGIATPITVFDAPVKAGPHTATFLAKLDDGGRHVVLKSRWTFTAKSGAVLAIVPDVEQLDIEHGAQIYVREIDCAAVPSPDARGQAIEPSEISLTVL